MRSDMGKVVTERPRQGHSMSYGSNGLRAEWKTESLEEAVKHSSMRKMHKRDRFKGKAFSDLLGPLTRFLRSRVGKNWNKVNSEIAKNLKLDSMSGYHIRSSHLEGMVEKNPQLIDGKYYRPIRWSYQGKHSPIFKDEFFVDKEGILREGKYSYRAQYRKRSKTPLEKFEKDGFVYQKAEGIWYKHWTTEYETSEPVYETRRSKENELYRAVIGHRKVMAKRGHTKQLNTKELKALKIQNG